MWILGSILAFILMYREYRGEDQRYIQRKDLVSLIIATIFSWATVGIWITVGILFTWNEAEKCADIKPCKSILGFLDKFIGR